MSQISWSGKPSEPDEARRGGGDERDPASSLDLMSCPEGGDVAAVDDNDGGIVKDDDGAAVMDLLLVMMMMMMMV